ncbi:hypothetical protein T4E_10376 [Trichinella pseudospiralis]|uniref:Uncharacterized protein n=1 Tax=Trichinella pseudospiralis TaxID=6337 RepID=A0A0V0XTU6_TRIPS|nr:hypothetical protein T4E_10376 [Trichinella pseudospiralis]
MPLPANIAKLRSFLSMCNYYTVCTQIGGVERHAMEFDRRAHNSGGKGKAVVEFTPPAYALSPRVAHCASSGCTK